MTVFSIVCDGATWIEFTVRAKGFLVFLRDYSFAHGNSTVYEAYDLTI